MRPISLPVLEKIKIEKYGLYPGKNNDGLEYLFKPGSNVIVGINGLGKTTLLKIIHRTLLGPFDLRGENEVGGGKRKPIETSTKIFSQRALDHATNAIVTLIFSINGVYFELVRSLNNLEIRSLHIENTVYDTQQNTSKELEDIYQDAIIKATFHLEVTLQQEELPTYFYDFILLVNYIIFYLEGRRSLVWDAWAQTEILRILFVPEEFQSKYITYLNQALSSDSEARNKNAPLTKLKKKYYKLKATAQNATPEDINILRAMVDELKPKLDELQNKLTDFDKTRRDCRKELEQRKNDLETVRQELRSAREAELSLFFPKLTDYGKYVIAGIKSGQGCLVCGSHHAPNLQQVMESLTSTSSCPLCNTKSSQQEHITSEKPQASKEHVMLLEQKIKDLESAIEALQEKSLQTQKAYAVMYPEYIRQESTYKEHCIELEAKEPARSKTDMNELEKLKLRIELEEEDITKAWAEKEAALHELSEISRHLLQSISSFKEDLTSSFSNFVSSFLAEECYLSYVQAPRNIGQGRGAPITFPEFKVCMTSGVFDTGAVARETIETVSESQKEFIELAFRMAFTSTALKGQQASLLIETPEANLDAVFIPKAGHTLNRFADNSSPAHVLVTTSNLNGTSMVKALLGYIDEFGENYPNQADASDRVLNLLNIAHQNTALLKYKEEYDKNYANAVYPSQEVVNDAS